ncbi:TRAP transporter large permease [Ornithinimicrobium sufpigmenti]|uniref:TRAP transporter large permease n=1 Tax=Ornithinimicrobium sufpigmenti TaxID=2508882 RepID=UPI00103676E4|nr:MULTISPECIES: TRAP transporter large permease [unclassified Ornithinimicrobium]
MDLVTLAALVLFAGIVVSIILGFPIAVGIGLSSLAAAAVFLGPERAVFLTAQRMFTGTNSFPLLAIPLFVLAGALMNTGGIAARLIDAAKVLTGRLPSSLAATNVVANGLFGSVSGAAVAAAAAVGTVTQPRMREEGYNRAYAAAVNVASAPAGMLLPPSNTFIVYSLVSSTSIAALFMAGVGPGLVWLIACLGVVMFMHKRWGVADQGERPTLGQALLVLWRAVPSLLMIFIVVGGILAGWFTPTESAAIAVVYCLVLGFAYRQLTAAKLPGVLAESARTTAIVMLLVGVSSALSFMMAFARIPEFVSDLLLGLTTNPQAILIIMMIILLAVGTFMDPTPAILIFTPIFLPIVITMGIDPIHFGAIIVYNLSVGVITPPVGNVLFIGARVAGLRIEPVTGKLLWFLAAIIVGLFVVVFVPQLSMWLPTVLGLV